MPNEEPRRKHGVLRWIGNLLYWPGPYPDPKILEHEFRVVTLTAASRARRACLRHGPRPSNQNWQEKEI
jgi:hypothetical protein